MVDFRPRPLLLTCARRAYAVSIGHEKRIARLKELERRPDGWGVGQNGQGRTLE